MIIRLHPQYRPSSALLLSSEGRCFRTSVVFTLLMSAVVSLVAQLDNQFLSITAKDGLSHNTVTAIDQDHQGFLWIGTENGLNRYDGNQILQFKHDPSDDGSLSSDFILCIYEDRNDDLWIGTINGLNRISPSQGTISRVPLPLESELNAHHQINYLYQDKEDHIWVGTAGSGLFRMSSRDSSILHFQVDSDTLSLMNNFVQWIYEDESGFIWINTIFGLDKIDPATFEITSFPYPDLEELKTDNVGFQNLAHYLVEGELIIINQFYQSYKINIRDNDAHIQRIDFGINNNDDHHCHLDVPVNSYLLDAEETLLFGNGTGIYSMDLRSQECQIYSTLPVTSDTKQVPVPYRLFRDRDHNFWIGTQGQGVFLLKEPASQYKHFNSGTSYPDDISTRSIRTMVKGEDNNLWIGTLGDGVHRFAYQDDQLIRQQHLTDNSKQNALLADDIIKLLVDANGALWIATNGTGLNKYDPVQDKMTSYVSDPGPEDHPYPLTNDRIWALCEDHEGYIWAGTFYVGLNRINTRTGIVTHYTSDEEDSTSLSNNYIRTLLTDSRGNVWIGTRNGLNKWDPRKDRFERFFNQPDDPNSLCNNHIWTIYEDRQGIIWVGTALGLSAFDPDTHRFSRYYEKDGLVSNTVFTIQEDKNGAIWTSSDVGLSQQILGTSPVRFRSYDDKDRLGMTSFVPKSNLVDEVTGDLFYGGNGGMIVIKPDLIANDDSQQNLVIHSVSKVNRRDNNGSPMVNHFVHATAPLRFSHDDNNINIQISDLRWNYDFDRSYQYQLAGLSNLWYKLDDDMNISLTGLAPGDYQLNVRSQKFNMELEPSVNMLRLVIQPPWWASWWAYLIYSIAFLITLFGAFRFQLGRQYAMQEARRLQELDELKSDLFTSLSHEFRTPLTVISGMIEQVRKKPELWLDKGADMIQQNTSNLLSLVNQILDLRKLESRSLALNLTQINVIPYFRYLTESFGAYAQSKKIDLHFIAEDEEIRMDIDTDKILKVVSNLISNAIKFTPSGGNIFFTLEQSRKGQRDYLQLKIRDTGQGIPKDKISKIFDKFYQIDQSSAGGIVGSGIGLSLTKELIDLMNGTIEVKSLIGSGTTFNIELPITQLAPLEYKDATSYQVAPSEFIVEDTHPSDMGKGHEIPAKVGRTRLLIVEDNDDVRQYLLACLQSEFEIDLAKDGAEGVDMAVESVPDVIISDVMMPHKDGYDLCRELKHDIRTSHIPIILLTAKADQESRIRGLEVEADAYLIKPFDDLELKVQIKNLLSSRMKLQSKYSVQNAPQTHLSKEDEFLQRIKTVIMTHIEDDRFGIPQLCREMNLSRSQLHNKLKALTGDSTAIHIRSIKLDHAKTILYKGKNNVSEVAYMVGFKDPKYFSRLFTEAYGTPPSSIIP